jgi:Ca2+-binding EF-hand superfamily protein
MREMFDAIDTDRNGFVDVEELKSTFASLGVPLSNNDVKQMLKEANIQGTRIFFEGKRACMTSKHNFNLLNNIVFCLPE